MYLKNLWLDGRMVTASAVASSWDLIDSDTCCVIDKTWEDKLDADGMTFPTRYATMKSEIDKFPPPLTQDGFFFDAFEQLSSRSVYEIDTADALKLIENPGGNQQNCLLFVSLLNA